MARRTGVKIETIRYYERCGVLPRPDRTAGGNRQYDHEMLKRLNFVRRSRDMGFSLKEVRALLEMVDENTLSCAEVHQITTVHLDTIRRRISGLKRLEKALGAMAAECSRGDVPDCPIVDTLYEGHALPGG
ncbi:MAG: helix-turn-helix domain-containing protein [Alphaproteobacteria bacterium]|nr:helix-turn-helix domain-containing protein [Alphaproteobacteria bacterium]